MLLGRPALKAACGLLAWLPAQGGAGGAAAKGKGALMVREDQEEGHVSLKVYWRYIQSYGVIAFAA